MPRRRYNSVSALDRCERSASGSSSFTPGRRNPTYPTIRRLNEEAPKPNLDTGEKKHFWYIKK